MFLSLLRSAVEDGKVDEVERLLRDEAHSVSGEDLKNVFMTACDRGDAVVAQCLVGHGADVHLMSHQQQASLMCSAARKSCVGVVKCMLTAGVDVDLVDDVGRTALSWACEEGHYSVVEELLKNEANVDLRDKCKKTALHYSRDNKDGEIVKALLNAGADVNITDSDGSSPLLLACRQGHDNKVEELLNIWGHLLSAGAYINKLASDGSSLHAMACLDGNANIVEKLLNAGADVNLTDSDGTSPLLYACESAYVTIVEKLLNAGADINATNSYGQTPLLMACSNRGGAYVVKMLLDAGVDVNVPVTDTFGYSLPVMTCSSGEHDIVEMLLNAGADILVGPDKEHYHTVLGYAACYDDTSAVRMLLVGGADAGIELPSTFRYRNSALVLALFGNVSFLSESVLDWSQDHHDLYVQMSAAGLIPPNFKCDSTLINIDITHHKTCSSEIARMKSEPVPGTSFSFHDVLIGRTSRLDFKQEQTLSLPFCTEKFPIYGELLHTRFIHSLVRQSLFDQCVFLLNNYSNFDQLLPEVIEHICSFWSPLELRCVIRLFQAHAPQSFVHRYANVKRI